MPAKTMDLLIEQGATFELDFTWMDTVVHPDGTTENVAKNLTGCSARMQVRTGYDRDVMVDATSENGEIVLGDAGSVKVVLSANLTDLAPITFGTDGRARFRKKGAYDLEVQWPDGRVDRVLEGRVVFSPNITRPTT